MIALNDNLVTADGQAKPPARPEEGQRTLAQTAYGGRVGGIGGWGGGWYGLPGSMYGSTFGAGQAELFSLFPKGVYFTGSYANYRLMRCHPIIALAEAIVTGPIEGGAWSYKKRGDDVPDERVELVEEQFEALRASIVEEAMEAVSLGCQPFELVWENRAGRLGFRKFKPLSHEMTSIVVDKAGEFAGVTQGGLKDALDRFKSFVYTHNGRAGNYYGRSRLENVREMAWAPWLDAATNLRALRRKLTGIFLIGRVPPGTPPDSTGPTDTWMSRMQSTLPNMAEAGGIVYETLGFANEDLANNPELAKLSLNSIEFFDAGNVAAAQAGHIEDLTHSEMLMFAGMLRSARTGLESKNGSRADAEQHTDTGIADSARIDRELARQLNDGPVNALLELNFGPAARGSVYIQPAPLVDRKREVLKAVLDKLLALPGVGDQIANEVIDVDKVIDGMEIDRKGDFKPIGLAQPPDPNAPPVPPDTLAGGDGQ